MAALAGHPDGVVARCVEPVRHCEPYYEDALCRHLDIVCEVLHAAQRWPPCVPFLIDGCQPLRHPSRLAMAGQPQVEHARSSRRAVEQAAACKASRRQGSRWRANRLEVALALAGRQLVSRRAASDGQAVGVALIEALRQRAVAMWRTHADTMPDEAAVLSVLAVADLARRRRDAGAPWTLLSMSSGR